MNKLLSRKEYEELVKSFSDGYCPLCDLGKQIVLGESDYWVWIANLSPYWKFHTMLIPKRHISDFTDLKIEELEDLQIFYKRIIKHFLSLGIKQDSGSNVDQFVLMIRTRFDSVENGSTYYKPVHLHLHLVPDKEGVDRFIIDPEAIEVDIQQISLK
ncbi:HIT domain-containing protein [Candidatus Nomurabacteria bacterium]|nr:HIT domain-containing protein [Candidatus Nomurabacteria bacterium]